MSDVVVMFEFLSCIEYPVSTGGVTLSSGVKGDDGVVVHGVIHDCSIRK